eukprot:TRINITY_DN20348_c0_g1_i1.p1 TRINITY_DN20348_c0_g1~~TRINITY_DN20348_c0_g1_i1.p1  ORF type:complete len:227 (+),score=33.85 TRINITY_DN20348_c0_g1_i1:98-778(+)
MLKSIVSSSVRHAQGRVGVVSKSASRIVPCYRYSTDSPAESAEKPAVTGFQPYRPAAETSAPSKPVVSLANTAKSAARTLPKAAATAATSAAGTHLDTRASALLKYTFYLPTPQNNGSSIRLTATSKSVRIAIHNQTGPKMFSSVAAFGVSFPISTAANAIAVLKGKSPDLSFRDNKGVTFELSRAGHLSIQPSSSAQLPTYNLDTADKELLITFFDEAVRTSFKH